MNLDFKKTWIPLKSLAPSLLKYFDHQNDQSTISDKKLLKKDSNIVLSPIEMF